MSKSEEEKALNKKVNRGIVKWMVKWSIIMGIAYLILENFGDKGLIIAGCIVALGAVIYFLIIVPNTNSGDDGL